MTFSDLGLSPEVLKAVADAGYTEPTPIQSQAIPYVLMGRDVLGTAQTGTGKTAGFTLPLIDILAGGRARARMPRALVLEPTRELADQVAKSFETYGKYNKLSMALLIGGVSYADQEKLLDRGVDVLIATPGRLLDHFERGRVMLGGVSVFVIDEADRMMDMGFMPDVERIVKMLPPLRQTLFFSATMAPEMRRLANAFLSNPKEVAVAPQASAALTVIQALVMVNERDKHEALRQLIRAQNVKNAIIFCNRKRDVDILAKSLVKNGFDAAPLHGDMSQGMRTETLEKFKAGGITLLIASDVAARGLDVQGLSHVFNFDVPIHAEDYIHRIGRTGRAGQEGHAFTLASADDAKFLGAITHMLGKPIPTSDIVLDLSPVEASSDEAPARSGRGRPRRGAERSESAPKAAPARSRRARPEPAAVPANDVVAQAEPVAAEPVAAAAEPHSAVITTFPERPAPAPRDDRRCGHDDGSDRRVVGLGDHVPAFLMRPSGRRG